MTWLLPRKHLVLNKICEVSLKILHKCDLVYSVLAKCIPNCDPLCSFCHLENESLTHLLGNALLLKLFGLTPIFSLTENWISLLHYMLNVSYLVLLIFKERGKKHVINFLILLGKFHNHARKFAKQKPNFTLFWAYRRCFLNSLKMLH